MEAFDLMVEAFVEFMLPLDGGGIAEEQTASEGSYGMDAAEVGDLEGAAIAGPVPD